MNTENFKKICYVITKDYNPLNQTTYVAVHTRINGVKKIGIAFNVSDEADLPKGLEECYIAIARKINRMADIPGIEL